MIDSSSVSQHSRWSMSIAFGLILLAGILMRLYALGQHPYGIYQDEAINGLDALRVLDGEMPLYFEANNGREPLFIYLVAAGIGLFGRTPLGLRAASAMVGILTIPTTYLLGRAWHTHRTGLIAASLLAVTLWHVHLSRISFRAVSLPLIAGLGLGVGALALRRQSRRLAVMAGALYGLSFYTYLAVRFTPLALFGIAIYGWIWHREWVRVRWHLILWIAAAAFIVAIPLGVYALQHPDIVLGRSDQVAIWNRPDFAGTLLQNIARSAGAFTWRGDWIWRHNVPNRPIFDPLIGLAFLAGVILAVRQWRSQPALPISLIWIVVMLLPTLLADDAPHFLRMVGVLPVVTLFPAVALATAYERLASKSTRQPHILPFIGLMILLASSTALTARDYFGCRISMPIRVSGFNYANCYRTDPVRGYFFQAQATSLAQEVNSTGGAVYLDRRFWDTFPSIRFIVNTSNQLNLYTEGESLSPANSLFSIFAWPHAGLRSIYEALPDESTILVAPGPETRGDQEPEPYRLYVRYTVNTVVEDVEPSEALARFANGFDLLSVSTEMRDGTLIVNLIWRASQEQAEPVQAFIHLLDEHGDLIAQIDEPPGTVYYPPLSWSRGSVIIHRVELADSQSSERSLRVGLYDPTTSERIPVLETSASWQDNALLLRVGGTSEP